MFIQAFSPLETQWLYRTQKSAVANVVVFVVAAGGNELEHNPFQTTSAQESELDTIAVLF